MTTRTIFAWAWTAGWTLLVLPLSLALLRGWAPAWARRATPRMLRARGLGGLILWASAASSAAFLLAGAAEGDWFWARTLTGPVAVVIAVGLCVVTDLVERRRRRVPSPASQ